MAWQRREPQLWPHEPGVAVLEAEPGIDRDLVVSRWLTQQDDAAGSVWHLRCGNEEEGVWAGMRSLIEGLLPALREAAPELLSRHAREICLVLPELRFELSFAESMADSSSDGVRFRQAAADRAYRCLNGLIDLLDEWHRLAAGGPWAIVCEDFEATSELVRWFFATLVRRRGPLLELRMLLVVGPGRGDEASAPFEPGAVADKVRLALRRESTTLPPPEAMNLLARELEAEIGEDQEASEAQLLRLASAWALSTVPDRALRWQLCVMEYYNRAALYEAGLPYAANVEAGLDRLYGEDTELYAVAISGLFLCYSAMSRGSDALPLLEEALIRAETTSRAALCCYMLAMTHTRFVSPPDLPVAEQYLERALRMLNEGELDDERHFLVAYMMNGLALVRMRQGRSDDAIELCEGATAHLDAHFDAASHLMFRSILIFNLAQVHTALGAYPQAASYFTEAITMDPGYSEYYNDRGSVYLKMDRLEDAENDLLQAIELTAPCPEFWTNLGQCRRALGKFDEAVIAYSKALDLSPRLTLAVVGRADAQLSLDRDELALIDYDQALELEPDQPFVLASRAIVHYQAGRLPAALADLDRAVALAPEVGDLYQNRAIALQDVGQEAGAARDFTTYLQLCPDADDREDVELRLHALGQSR